MKIIYRICNGIIKGILLATCKIDRTEIKKIPMEGPFILVANHINFLEAPILYLFMRPRRTIALAKAELWENSFTRFLMNLWEVVPIKRGAADFNGMKMAFNVLKEKDFLCLAPEGTRSRTGLLKKGKAGVILFAQKGAAPIIPIAHWGGESIGRNLKRFRRTPVTIKVGEPLQIRKDLDRKIGPTERQEIADEAMIALARLMPEKYHGYYKGKTQDEFKYLIPCKTESSE